jgi:hypothetical protein
MSSNDTFTSSSEKETMKIYICKEEKDSDIFEMNSDDIITLSEMLISGEKLTEVEVDVKGRKLEDIIDRSFLLIPLKDFSYHELKHILTNSCISKEMLEKIVKLAKSRFSDNEKIIYLKDGEQLRFFLLKRKEKQIGSK